MVHMKEYIHIKISRSNTKVSFSARFRSKFVTAIYVCTPTLVALKSGIRNYTTEDNLYSIQQCTFPTRQYMIDGQCSVFVVASQKIILGPVSLRLMTSQFKDIVTHTQKYITVKCTFYGVWVQNFV